MWHTCSILLIAAGPGKCRIAITCRITLNHLSTAAMRLMSNYFHHLLFLEAHIDSRTDSQALRAEYCLVLINTIQPSSVYHVLLRDVARDICKKNRNILLYPACKLQRRYPSFTRFDDNILFIILRPRYRGSKYCY